MGELAFVGRPLADAAAPAALVEAFEGIATGKLQDDGIADRARIAELAFPLVDEAGKLRQDAARLLEVGRESSWIGTCGIIIAHGFLRARGIRGCPGFFPERGNRGEAREARSPLELKRKRHVVLPDLHAAGITAWNASRLPGAFRIRSAFGDKRLPASGAPDKVAGGAVAEAASGLEPFRDGSPKGPALSPECDGSRSAPLEKRCAYRDTCRIISQGLFSFKIAFFARCPRTAHSMTYEIHEACRS